MPGSKLLACLNCTKYKRCCDRATPVCGTCAKAGKQCLYRQDLSAEELEKIKLIQSEKRRKRLLREREAKAAKEATTMEVAKWKAFAPSVDELTKLETMMDELVLSSCVDNFERNMGTLFCFGNEFSDLASLHSTPALSIRTDAALSLVYRGMGWTQQAELSLSRAKSNVGAILSDPSGESLTATTMLGMALIRGDGMTFMNLMRSAAMTRSGFNIELNMCKALEYFFKGCFDTLLSADAQEISRLATQTIFQRVQVRAKHVRQQLEKKLSLLDIVTYGPFDYADGAGGWYAEDAIDEKIARDKLAELDDVEETIRDMISKLDVSPQLPKIGNERFDITMSASRCILHHYLGHVDEARRWGYATLSLFSTVSATMWFFMSSSDLIHVVDVAIATQDRVLFDQALQVIRNLAPLYPIAAKLLFALSDTAALFEENSTHKIEVLEAEDALDEMSEVKGGLEAMMEAALVEDSLTQWIDTA